MASKFAGELSGASFLQGAFTSQLQATGVDATAYAARLPSGHVAVIILNKDAEQNRSKPGLWNGENRSGGDRDAARPGAG